jgi:hypothetical protein
MECLVQLISEDLGLKLEKVTPEMLGSCKKVGDVWNKFLYLLVLLWLSMSIIGHLFVFFELRSGLNLVIKILNMFYGADHSVKGWHYHLGWRW